MEILGFQLGTSVAGDKNMNDGDNSLLRTVARPEWKYRADQAQFSKKLHLGISCSVGTILSAVHNSFLFLPHYMLCHELRHGVHFFKLIARWSNPAHK